MSLITQISEVEPYLPMAYATSVEAIPSVTIAEEKYLLTILGDELYNDLQQAYDNDTMTADDTALMDKCRAVIVPFAYVEDLPFRQVLLSDNGLVALENTGSRKAFKWEYNNSMEALQARGYAAQEVLIRFLKTNKDTYPLWADSSYNDPMNFLLIRGGDDLGGLLALEQKQRVYMQIRSLFNTIAEDYLKPNLSEAYYTALNQRLLEDTLTDDDKYILPKLRMYCARIAMALASVEMNIKFNGTSFTIVDTRIKDTIDEGRANANDGQLLRFKTQMENQASTSLDQIITYMNSKASNTRFTEFFSSGLYKDPNETTKHIDNSTKRGTFAITL